MPNEKWINLLLEKTQLLPHNLHEFTQIELQWIDLFTDKATFLTFKLNGTLHERWIPNSQIRKDLNNKLWITNWFIKTNKLKEKSKYPPQETSGEIICDSTKY